MKTEGRGRRLRRDWTLAFIGGELVGFVPPAVAGAWLGSIGASDPVMIVALTVAGCGEGAALGWAQARVLRRYAPELDGRAWTRRTAAAAGFAWLAGMGGSALMAAADESRPLLLVVLVPVWLGALVGMGALQWTVMRRKVPGSGRWIPVTALAWMGGVMIPTAALSLTPDAAPMMVRALAAVVGAVAMGAFVGGLTGRTLERLLVTADRGEAVKIGGGRTAEPVAGADRT